MVALWRPSSFFFCQFHHISMSSSWGKPRGSTGLLIVLALQDRVCFPKRKRVTDYPALRYVASNIVSIILSGDQTMKCKNGRWKWIGRGDNTIVDATLDRGELLMGELPLHTDNILIYISQHIHSAYLAWLRRPRWRGAYILGLVYTLDPSARSFTTNTVL